MKRKSLITSWAGFVGAVAIVLLANLPGFAQMTPRTSIPEIPSTPGTAPTVPSRIPSGTPAAPMPSSMTSVTSLDQEFMKTAANSDQFEIKTSQLALQKSSNSEVKQYAQKMIQEHTESTRQLTQLALQKRVTLPNAPNPFQQAVIDQLTLLSSAEFDRAYLAGQTNGHMQAVAVFQTEVGQGKDADVQSFASKLLPTIAGHYQMASQMSGQQNVLNMPSTNPTRSR